MNKFFGAALLATALLALPSRPVAASDTPYTVLADAGSIDTPAKRPPVPDISFLDGTGSATGLARMRGKAVFLVLWAPSCGPCLRGLQALDSMRQTYAGPTLEIIALAQDRDPTRIRDFLKTQKLANLKVYVDVDSRAAAALGFQAMPAAILIDTRGREVGRFVGAAKWDNPPMVELIRKVAAGG